jgi:hypothetical protein
MPDLTTPYRHEDPVRRIRAPAIQNRSTSLTSSPTPWRRILAEFVGTALLVTAVVGSGIMAATLSPRDVGLQLLENSVATALALGALILMFGPVSGAHFNPVVSAADWFLGRRTRTGLTATELAGYVVAQIAGGRRVGPGQPDVRAARRGMVQQTPHRRALVAG